MSFLSTPGNVGFSGIPQNLSDTSCASQYKMAVEGVPACGEDGTTYIHDTSGDEQVYMSHISDNFFHTKYKIDPNDLYTFHDSDVIAGEITVSHTDDSPLVFVDLNEVKSETCPQSDIDIIGKLVNGEIKQGVKDDIFPNGHYPHKSKSDDIINAGNVSNTKIQNVGKKQLCSKESVKMSLVNDSEVADVRNLKSHNVIEHDSGVISKTNTKNSISSVNVNNINQKLVSKTPTSETFLDVYKREQIGFTESNKNVKAETNIGSVKTSAPASHKTSSNKVATPAKSKRGRGPAVHEALQRIPSQRRAQVVQNQVWHAPGNELFECGPLTECPPHPFTRLDSSSDDDEQMPNFSSWMGSGDEGNGEPRGTRLANRRAALRRQVVQAAAAVKLLPAHRKQRALAHFIKRQSSTPGRLPARTVVRLLAARGMPTLLSSQDRHRLREGGWSGGESGSCFLETSAPLSGGSSVSTCLVDGCSGTPLPCGRYCLAHVTRAPEQRLYAACAAVFASGSRCKQPLLPLHDQTPLCTEHAWKRDNYDKLSRECKPKKVVRKRVFPATPRRAKRRRRPPARRPPPPAPTPTPAHAAAIAATIAPPTPQSINEICASNSSAYESGEEAVAGALGDTELMARAAADLAAGANRLEVGVVEQVPPDDILDPAVLNQIPDEAFTEFFNQAEGAPAFAESEELERALAAVLDGRALDSLADCVFHHPPTNKLAVPQVGVEMSSSAPS